MVIDPLKMMTVIPFGLTSTLTMMQAEAKEKAIVPRFSLPRRNLKKLFKSKLLAPVNINHTASLVIANAQNLRTSKPMKTRQGRWTIHQSCPTVRRGTLARLGGEHSGTPQAKPKKNKTAVLLRLKHLGNTRPHLWKNQSLLLSLEKAHRALHSPRQMILGKERQHILAMDTEIQASRLMLARDLILQSTPGRQGKTVLPNEQQRLWTKTSTPTFQLVLEKVL